MITRSNSFSSFFPLPGQRGLRSTAQRLFASPFSWAIGMLPGLTPLTVGLAIVFGAPSWIILLMPASVLILLPCLERLIGPSSDMFSHPSTDTPTGTPRGLSTETSAGRRFSIATQHRFLRGMAAFYAIAIISTFFLIAAMPTPASQLAFALFAGYSMDRPSMSRTSLGIFQDGPIGWRHGFC